jgi:hypothetical protein
MVLQPVGWAGANTSLPKRPACYGCDTWSLKLREEYRLDVFENRVLGRIFGPKRSKVLGACRRLHSEELHNLYTSSNIIRVNKSRGLTGAGHVVRMLTRFWTENLKGRDHAKDLRVDGRIILEWVLGK